MITDYTGTPIIKVDQEGGIFGSYRANGMPVETMSPQPDRTRSFRSQKGKPSFLTGMATSDFVADEACGGPSASVFATNQKTVANRLSDKYFGLQAAMQAVNKTHTSAGSDVDSTLSNRGLMQRKLYLMKKMLKNEKQANKMIQ